MKRELHREENWRFPFISYTPENPGKKLPLVLQLHGAGERGSGGEDLDLVEVWGFPQLLKSGEYPCMFVFPQCPKETFWAARVESILAFVDQLLERYDIDPDRIYLTGLSMGGYGTWYTAMAAPERFAAIAPVCGGGIRCTGNRRRRKLCGCHHHSGRGSHQRGAGCVSGKQSGTRHRSIAGNVSGHVENIAER